MSQNFPYSKLLLVYLAFVGLETTKSLTTDRNFLKVSPRSQKEINFLHPWHGVP